MKSEGSEQRVLVLAPVGRDGELITSTLCAHGMLALKTEDIQKLCEKTREGAGAVVLTEEALLGEGASLLGRALEGQPPWSDLPIIILTTSGDDRSERTWQLVGQLKQIGNVSLLERPLRTLTLIHAVQAALRSRRRQYEVRALHEDLEQRVSERTAELQRLNTEAEGFTFSISHDLRTPLRTIVATSTILLEDHAAQLDGDGRLLLDRQARAASKLATLIDDLLKLSRLSRQDMTVEDFDLSNLTEAVTQDLDPQNACTWEIQPYMEARGDKLLIRFVLQNLLHNAIKFSASGGKISIGQTDGEVFFVRDEGIGFDMAYVDKVFMPFERLVRDEEFPGTGIGLANVKRIIERHGGRIWVHSSPGQGTTFYFTLRPQNTVDAAP
jgi:signal transduction histidine kinase